MADQQPYRISAIRLACILATFMAISFLLCLAAGYVLPGLRYLMPLGLIPDFTWSNPLSGALGFVWSISFGIYVGVLFALVHNLFGGAAQVPSCRSS